MLVHVKELSFGQVIPRLPCLNRQYQFVVFLRLPVFICLTNHVVRKLAIIRSPDNSFTTIYSQPGVYYPTVTVSDGAGLSDSASMEIVVNGSLARADWILSNTIPGTTISLDFGNGFLSGFGGCNTYSGSYSIPGKSNNVKMDPITSTGALCSDEINAQEQRYLANLQSAKNYTIDGSTLTLKTKGDPLTFYAAVATPAAAPTVSQ